MPSIAPQSHVPALGQRQGEQVSREPLHDASEVSRVECHRGACLVA